MVWDEVCLMNM